MKLDLNELFASAIKKIKGTNRIQEYIEKSVEETVKKSISDYFGSYSEFNKALSEAIKKQMKINFEELNLHEYNYIILDGIRKAIKSNVNSALKDKLVEQVNAIMQVAPKEITFSELLKQFKREYKEDTYKEDWELENKEINISFEDLGSNLGLYWVHIDVEHHSKSWEWKIKFCLNLDKEHKDDKKPFGKISSLSIKGIVDDKKVELSELKDFSRTLWQIFVSGGQIIMDQGMNEDHYDLGFNEILYNGDDQ